MKKKLVLSLLLVFVLAIMAACGDKKESDKDKENDKKPETSEEEALTPDLDDIPEIVAEVNDTEISKEDFSKIYTSQFQQAQVNAQISGEEFDETTLQTTIIDFMIDEELLIQGADKGNFKATEEAISEMLTGLAMQSGYENKDDYVAELTKQGLTTEEIDYQLENGIKVNLLIESETGDFTPTDDDLKKRYDEIKALQDSNEVEGEEQAEFPSFEDAKTELVQILKSEKSSETVDKLIKEYREDSDIKIHI